jgi:hypothetical protein
VEIVIWKVLEGAQFSPSQQNRYTQAGKAKNWSLPNPDFDPLIDHDDHPQGDGHGDDVKPDT